MGAWKKVLTFVLVSALLSVLFPAPTGFQPLQASAGDGGSFIYLPMIFASLPTVIPESTNILTDESNQYLVSISADTVQLVFSQTTPELDKVEPGEVIVSGIARAAPKGYLRKVLTEEVINGQVVLTTGPASLEEAIEQASLSITHEFSQADIVEISALPGVTLTVQGSAAPDVGLVNLQLDKVLLDGNLVASGSLALDMSMDFDFTIKRFSLKSMRMVLIATETTALNLVSSKEAAGNEEYEIGRFRLTPMTIMVGSFPIVVQPTIVVMLGVDGSVSAALTTGVTQQLTLSGGVEYVDGALSPVKDFNNDFSYQEPSISAQMSVFAYAGAGLELDFYSASPLVPELELDLRIGPRLQADQSLCWVLDGMLVVDLEAELTFIKWELAEVQTTLVSLATPLVYAQKCLLLEVTRYGNHLVATSYAQAALSSPDGNLWDARTDYKEISDLEAKAGVVTLETGVTITLSDLLSQTSSNGSVTYEAMTNSLGIPSIITGTVTFDTAWSYNPNQVADSTVNGEARGRYGASLAPHVDGDFIINYSSDVERSDAGDHIDGYIEWYSSSIGVQRFDIPINGSGVYTVSVTAYSDNAISFLPVGVYYSSGSWGSGTAHTTFTWTFVPAGSP